MLQQHKCSWELRTLAFILLMFSLAVKKLFILMKFHLFILSFMSLALGDTYQWKYCCVEYLRFSCQMFSSRTFMVLRLIFKAFIHLEFIFVYGVNWWLSCIVFFAWSCIALSAPVVEEDILTPFYASATFVKYQLTLESWVFF